MTGREATPPLHRTPCGPGGHELPHQPDERGYCAGCTGLFDVGRETTPGRAMNPDCTDKMGNPAWSCVEFDGTGLWCDSCVAFAETPPARETT